MTSRVGGRRFTATILRPGQIGDGAGGVVELFQPAAPPEQCMVALGSVSAARVVSDEVADVVQRRIVTVAAAALPADFSGAMRFSIGGEVYRVLQITRTGSLDRDRSILVARLEVAA